MIDAIEEVHGTSPSEQLSSVAHTAEVNRDRVMLSETARATLLRQDGFSLTEIADELGITMNVVLSELGIGSGSQL
jgi:hypothetical protein